MDFLSQPSRESCLTCPPFVCTRWVWWKTKTQGQKGRNASENQPWPSFFIASDDLYIAPMSYAPFLWYFCIPFKAWKLMRVSKWWQKRNFWVNYPFKCFAFCQMFESSEKKDRWTIQTQNLWCFQPNNTCSIFRYHQTYGADSRWLVWQERFDSSSPRS